MNSSVPIIFFAVLGGLALLTSILSIYLTSVIEKKRA